MHVSSDDNSYSASVSLKESPNTKAFISKTSLLLQGPFRSLGRKQAGAGEKGVVLRENRKTEGNTREGRGWGLDLKEKKPDHPLPLRGL